MEQYFFCHDKLQSCLCDSYPDFILQIYKCIYLLPPGLPLTPPRHQTLDPLVLPQPPSDIRPGTPDPLRATSGGCHWSTYGYQVESRHLTGMLFLCNDFTKPVTISLLLQKVVLVHGTWLFGSTAIRLLLSLNFLHEKIMQKFTSIVHTFPNWLWLKLMATLFHKNLKKTNMVIMVKRKIFENYSKTS